MEWVRCNSCGYYPSSLTRLSIFLTNCGHLVCSKCLERVPTSMNDKPGVVECLVCKQPCKTVKLGPDSRPGPDVTFYFGNQLSAVKKVQQAVEFQRMHQDALSETVKRERMLLEIKEAERQENELSEIAKKVEASGHYLSIVLQGLQDLEKTAGAGTHIPSPYKFTKNGQGCSSRHPSISPAQRSNRMENTRHLSTPLTVSLSGHGHSGQRGSTSTVSNRPQILTTASPVSTRPGPRGVLSSGDPRVTANLMTQKQMQNWTQQSPHQQQQSGMAYTHGTHAYHTYQSRPVLPPQYSPITMRNVQDATGLGRGTPGSTQARRSNMVIGPIPGSTLVQATMPYTPT